MLAVMQLLHGLGFPNAYLSTNRGGVPTMKSSHHFRDQLSVMTGWFEGWNDCEQTVALYSLIKKLGPAHARFLALVLDQGAQECAELRHLEQNANDPVFISNLSAESKETAVAQLLSHLPLLRPGNGEAKAQYLELIPKILAHSIRHSVHIEESRQLLSYSLIHPAISQEDRASLTQWLRQLEDRIHNSPSPTLYAPQQGYSNGVILNGPPLQSPDSFGGGQFGNGPVPRLDLWQPRGNLVPMNGGSMDVGYSVLSSLGSNSLPSGVGSHYMNMHGLNSGNLSSHPDGTQTLPMLHSRVKRSNSLTPPGNGVVAAQSGCSPSSSNMNLDQDPFSNHQSSSLRPDHHAPLSPQSSVTSSGSGSDGQKDEKDVFSQDGTGMKDVPSWLKGLRLHKYSYIFKNMTYEEMMSINEEKLEKMNITKGARHKIVLSIQKLRERQGNLKSLEKDLLDGEGNVRSALNEIKSMIQTPIKAFDGHTPLLDSTSVNNGGSESETSCSDPPSAPPSPTMHDADNFSRVAEGDLPGQMTRLLGKVCSNLLISPNQDENMNFFVMIVDKCLSHEAFTPVQKRRLFSWKQQVQKACHPLPPRRSLDTRQRNKWNSNYSSNGQSGGGEQPHEPIIGGSLRRRMPVQYSQQPPPNRLPVRQSLSTTGIAPSHHMSTLSSAVIKRPSLQDHTKRHIQIQRTNSAPVRPNPLPASMFGKSTDGADSNDPEINIRLESLCLSVTEHALGSFDGAVPLF